MIQWKDFTEEYRADKGLLNIEYASIWNETTFGRFFIVIKIYRKADSPKFVLIDRFESEEHVPEVADTFQACAELAEIISQQCVNCGDIMSYVIDPQPCSAYSFANDYAYDTEIDLYCTCCSDCRGNCKLE